MLYAGAAIGVALAGDLITVFVFWEVMAIGSTLILWSAGTDGVVSSQHALPDDPPGSAVCCCSPESPAMSRRPATSTFARMTSDSIAHWLILAGFLVNAGAPPLSAWLPDAYPEASWSGMVFLSAFTTKTAVYVLLRGFPGAEALVWIGVVMIFYGIVYALLENDMRRILAYSHREPGRLHGGRDRHRHRDGVERRRCACLHAHHLQGAAADVGRLGALYDRTSQVLRTWAGCSTACR